jgi:hypothetical protein
LSKRSKDGQLPIADKRMKVNFHPDKEKEQDNTQLTYMPYRGFVTNKVKAILSNEDTNQDISNEGRLFYLLEQESGNNHSKPDYADKRDGCMKGSQKY